mgnify:CR=1 FL=1
MAKEQLSPALSTRMEQEKKTHSYTDFSFPDGYSLLSNIRNNSLIYLHHQLFFLYFL